MRVLFVTSEVAGLYKRGGLADVSYSLPEALSKRGIDIAVALPYFEKIRSVRPTCIGQLAVDYDRRRELIFVFQTALLGTDVPVFLFRHPLFSHYDGPYIVERFAFFSKVVTQWINYIGLAGKGSFDIVHCNDWHTALIPLLLGENRKIGKSVKTLESQAVHTILSIHNHLYAGETGIGITLKLGGLSKHLFHHFTTPLGRAVRLLEEGLEYADMVTTVSPTYAKELMAGLHGVRFQEITKRRKSPIVGIVNGLDAGLWDPSHDSALPVKYTRQTVRAGKREVKRLLQKAVRLPRADVPLFGFVGRLESRQKGIDLIAHAVSILPPENYQLVLLGTGQKKMVTLFSELASNHPNISFVHTFDERLARRIYAGSDVMLVPSKYEPCGLTQLIAMGYGTVPLVRNTGGLADTVVDGKTGFVFDRYTRRALADAMQRAITLYEQDQVKFELMMRADMAQDFSWKHQVKEYIALYKRLLR